MTEPDDPSRLFDSASAPAGLKAALRAAEADVGSDEQVARLAQRLGPMLGAGAAASAGATAALSGTAKLGIAGLALLAVGGGAVWLSQSAPPAAGVAKSVLAPPALVTPALPVVPSPAPASSLEPSGLGTAPVLPAPSAAAPDKPSPPPQLSEVELLEQARAASKSDPARALSRANEHARRFPRGVLVQEREVLAIQALRRLGRDAEADRRAEAFAKAFPGSAFQRKLKPIP